MNLVSCKDVVDNHTLFTWGIRGQCTCSTWILYPCKNVVDNLHLLLHGYYKTLTSLTWEQLVSSKWFRKPMFHCQWALIIVRNQCQQVACRVSYRGSGSYSHYSIVYNTTSSHSSDRSLTSGLLHYMYVYKHYMYMYIHTWRKRLHETWKMSWMAHTILSNKISFGVTISKLLQILPLRTNWEIYTP